MDVPSQLKFLKIQLRLVRHYCRLHQEMSRDMACQQFIDLYAMKLRNYYENIYTQHNKI